MKTDASRAVRSADARPMAEAGCAPGNAIMAPGVFSLPANEFYPAEYMAAYLRIPLKGVEISRRLVIWEKQHGQP